MPSRIRVLDEHTINKIAAGEVIENPASVVKELVENSIDAGATEICVEIKGGGRQLIRVTDNGCGMNRDDALLCLERHATSKIKAVEDIHEISTMGFRGEAIPSIASISKFTLLTCPIDGRGPENGTMVIVDGGRVFQCCDAVRNPGTTIEVKSLFFNVPVRKKFQKSPNYDANEILKMVSVIALGYPHIQFELISQQKPILTTHASAEKSFTESLENRIKEVLGPEFMSGLIPIENATEGYRIQGFVGLPHFNRHNRTGQFIFINHRAIQSPLLSFCIKESYGTTLAPNRHPVFVLHLEMPGSTVDVNVHPQKREVRVRQEHILKTMLTKAIEEALQSNAFTPETPALQDASFSSPFRMPLPSYSPEEFFAMERQPYLQPAPTISKDRLLKDTDIDPPMERIPFTRPPAIKQHPVFFPQEQAAPPARVIGTIRKYIIVDGGRFEQAHSGIAFIDQRAAHARVIFEHLCKVQSSSPLMLQSLLIPYTWETSPAEAAVIREQMTFFNELGIKIHEIGPSAFLIDALPALFGNMDIQLLVNDVIHRLQECRDDSRQLRRREKEIASAASRAAVSQNKQLRLEEAQNLVDRLMQCESPFQCPQGQPTIAFLNPDEIQKLFSKAYSKG